ncbi:probable cytochrome P450 6a21 [Uranotaenia lowii]|uniref:probable cytochrome P450 6a21 n=1 Tax=Uranotaenia lowii TaxID=190385 RepID=UPI00247AD386|nr:probable cytochrome P450 6a21 [Uranotaenia lowii]
MALMSILLAALVAGVVGLILFMRGRHRFWSDRNFPCAPDAQLLLGHMQARKIHQSYQNKELYDRFKERGLQYGGYSFFLVPAVMLVDPELVKTVLVRDFSVFHDRGIYCNPEADPLSGHLFLLEGQPWRTLRQKLTPTFTSGRMKSMFGTIMEVAEEFRLHMVENYNAKPEMEMKNVLIRFTTDVIGTCAFGLQCNTLKNPNSEFLKNGERIFVQKPMDLLKFVFASVFKEFSKSINLKLTEPDVEKFFLSLTRDTVEYREKNNVERNDFLNLLLQLKNRGYLTDNPEDSVKETVKLTMNEVAAQSFVFFIAGFETSSTTMNFCLYELAMNQEIQDRLRVEINKAVDANGGEITYELVMGLQYLDNVINETLRKYPPIESLNRVPIRDYQIPDTNHTIPSQTMITIPVYAIHHDPEHYPNPKKFDPDRFLPENVQSRHQYTFLPFGEGPRVCIGLRFGLMQTKIGLITLLRSFRFRPSPLTPDPIVFEKNTFVLAPEGGNYLHIDKI